jgi:hypothetical protein
MHCKEDAIYVFPEIKLRGLVPNFSIHVSVSNLYIPRIGPPILLQQNRWTYSRYIKIANRYIPRSFVSGNTCFESSVQFGSTFHKLVYKVGTGENLRYILCANSHLKPPLERLFKINCNSLARHLKKYFSSMKCKIM